MSVKTYSALRKELSDRDKSLREKTMSLEEASELVCDGDIVGVGGSTLSRTAHGDDLGAGQGEEKEFVGMSKYCL